VPGEIGYQKLAPMASWRILKRIFRSTTTQVESYSRAIDDASDIPVVITPTRSFSVPISRSTSSPRLATTSAHRRHQGCLDQ